MDAISTFKRFRGTYRRHLLLAIAIWSLHFWILGAAFIWLPLEILVLALPVVIGSAVVLVWRLEQRMNHQIEIATHGVNPWLIVERSEPLLPQPQSGWKWQYSEDHTARALADPSLRREAA